MSLEGYLLLAASALMGILGIVQLILGRRLLGFDSSRTCKLAWWLNAVSAWFVATLLFLAAQGPLEGRTVAYVIASFLFAAAVLVVVAREGKLTYSITVLLPAAAFVFWAARGM